MQTEHERAEKVMLVSRNSICDSVVAGLALGRTYCELAKWTNRSLRRHHLFTLACEALSMAEDYVATAPSELLCGVLEDAQRLRLEIRQLEGNA